MEVVGTPSHLNWDLADDSEEEDSVVSGEEEYGYDYDDDDNASYGRSSTTCCDGGSIEGDRLFSTGSCHTSYDGVDLWRSEDSTKSDDEDYEEACVARRSSTSEDLYQRTGSGRSGQSATERQLSEDELRSIVGDSALKLVWSKGSACHHRGCMPCHNHQTERGCPNGMECSCCHMPHTTSSTGGSFASQEERLKVLADTVVKQAHGDQESMVKACKVLASGSTFLRMAILWRMDDASDDRNDESFDAAVPGGSAQPPIEEHRVSDKQDDSSASSAFQTRVKHIVSL